MRKLHLFVALPVLGFSAVLWTHCQHPDVANSNLPDAQAAEPVATPGNPVSGTPEAGASSEATTKVITATPVPTDEKLRSMLANLARAHDQKTQLAFYESMPWRKAPEPYHSFYVNMGKVQADLLKDIQAWAKSKNMDLTFHFTPDAEGHAQQIMEARQEKLVRGDATPDFVRDTLMQMYDDYEWQISLIQALLPSVRDPQLKAYLQKSLQVHEAGSAQLNGLLKHYK